MGFKNTRCLNPRRLGPQRHDMTALGITEIELDRFLGFGSCPDFRFTARADGRYVYEGRYHIEPIGERSGRFPGYLFARLAEVCADLDILSLADTYPAVCDGVGVMLLTVRHAGGVKVVRNEIGDTCPPRLWAFAIVIEHAMRQAFRTEDRRGGKNP